LTSISGRCNYQVPDRTRILLDIEERRADLREKNSWLAVALLNERWNYMNHETVVRDELSKKRYGEFGGFIFCIVLAGE
jgi:50S ribosomal subunit-associated GTPase HflX